MTLPSHSQRARQRCSLRNPSVQSVPNAPTCTLYRPIQLTPPLSLRRRRILMGPKKSAAQLASLQGARLKRLCTGPDSPCLTSPRPCGVDTPPTAHVVQVCAMRPAPTPALHTHLCSVRAARVRASAVLRAVQRATLRGCVHVRLPLRASPTPYAPLPPPPQHVDMSPASPSAHAAAAPVRSRSRRPRPRNLRARCRRASPLSPSLSPSSPLPPLRHLHLQQSRGACVGAGGHLALLLPCGPMIPSG